MLESLRRARAFVERYNLQHDPEVQEILELLAVVDDPELEQDLLEYLINVNEDQVADPNPFYPHPPAEAISGDVPIGMTETGAIAGINLGELQQGGMLITGHTGSGKTNAVANISKTLAEDYPDSAALWFFETVKKSFRHIMPEDTLIIPHKSDCFNPWREPPGVDYRDWEMGMIEITAQYGGLKEAGMNMLFECVQEANEIYGTYKGSGIRPTMLEIYKLMLLKREKYMRKKDTSKVGYIDRWTNKLIPFVSALKDVVGVDSGYPLEQLIDRNVIWEMDGLSTSLQTFLINVKLFWKMEYKKANPGKIKKLCVNVFDEGGRIFARHLYED